MNLGELISKLEKIPQDTHIEYGFGSPMSWRGSYYELAFEPVKNTTIRDMLFYAKDAIGNTYSGYKGGDFTMDEQSEVHIAFYGSTGEPITSAHIREWEA